MDKKICEAIKSQKIIEFFYDGLERVVEPHTYGVSTAGNDVLSAYQIDGQSNSDLPNWKLFTVDKISNLVVTDRTFTVEPGYTSGDSRMTEIYCEI